MSKCGDRDVDEHVIANGISNCVTDMAALEKKFTNNLKNEYFGRSIY